MSKGHAPKGGLGPRHDRDRRRLRDTTVFKAFTDQLVAGYSQRVPNLSYKTYPGVDHGGAVKNPKSAGDATSYIKSRLR